MLILLYGLTCSIENLTKIHKPVMPDPILHPESVEIT